jgi:hypothetical protein
MARLYHPDNIWSLIVSPTIWIVHFLFCYISAALFCAKWADSGDFNTLRLIIVIATLVALGGIIAAGAQAVDDWRKALDTEWEADKPTLRMRRRFVGRAAFLLAGLSAVGVIFVALTVFFLSSCQ